jgi:hypothetical protein
LENRFAFGALSAPLKLAAGDYAIVAYGLDVGGDYYANGGGTPTGVVTDETFDPFAFVNSASPAFPAGGDINDHSSASFIYAPEPGAWALMMLGFGALGSALRSRRSPLRA